MPGHQRDAAPGELVRDADRLARVAGVVADLERELAAEHAAGGIQVGHGLLGAGAHLAPESRVLAGHRTGGGDADRPACLGEGTAARQHQRRAQRACNHRPALQHS